MKKILTLLIIAFCAITAQSQTNNPNSHSWSLERVIKKLESDGIHRFMYKQSILKKAIPVDSMLNAGSFEDKMAFYFQNQPYLGYKISGAIVSVKELQPDSVLKNYDKFSYRLTGKVFAGDPWQPLQGASVRLKNKGVNTDHRGTFTLTWGPLDTLVISFVNYRSKLIPWHKTKELIVSLVRQESNLTEVVIGYSTKDKRSNTAGASTFKPGTRPAGNIINIIQESVPGMLVTSTSGIPGATQKLTIRGPNSIGLISGLSSRLSSDPLMIVNGITWPTIRPVNQLSSIGGDPNAHGVAASGLDPLYTLNPSDVESVTVLKDAEATAIYGAHGANGVILINTKKGTSREPRLMVTSAYGVGHSSGIMHLMNTQEYLDMRREAFKNDRITPDAVNAPDLLLWDTTRYTDFKKLLLNKTATNMNEQISFSNGGPRYQYLVSGGYNSQTTVLPADIYGKRYSLLSDFSYNSKNKKLKTGFSGISTYTENKWIAENVMYAMLLAPNAPNLKDSKGRLIWEDNNVSFNNPLSYFLNTNNIKTTNTLLHTYIQYKLFSKLHFETSIGYQRMEVHEKNRFPIIAQNPNINPTGTYNEANNRYTTWHIEPEFQYNDTLGNLQLQGLLGASYLSQINDRWKHSYAGYTCDGLLGDPNAAQSVIFSADKTRYRFLSCFARIKLNYKNRYFFSFTNRVDGSSRFGPKNRYANFGAIGAGWIFWNTTNKQGTASFAKLRGSYGITGSDQIGDYGFLNTWSASAQPYQGLTGMSPTGLSNPYYQWEVTRKTEAGLEVSLLERINLAITCYRNKSDNLLIAYSLPTQAGFGTLVRNFPAVIQNTGIEVETDFKKNWRHVTWAHRLTLAIPKNKLVQFPGLENSSYASTLVMGQPLNIVAGPQYTGVNATTGLFTADSSEKHIGNLDPVFFGGMRNTISFRHIELTAYLEFRKQKAPHYMVSVYNNYPPGEINEQFFNNQPAELVNRWRNPGDQVSWQRVSSLSYSPAYNAIRNYKNSDGQLVDASYIRLKNVQLTYSFPTTLLEKWRLKAVRIFGMADNLFTITSYKGADPELQNPFAIPLLRTFSIGIQITF